jgi:enamine deaminase RidA (YjgF/YER057c/UK114 family)
MSIGNGKQRVRLSHDEWNEPLAFSQGVVVGNQLWIAGQVPVDRDGTSVGVDDPEAQAEAMFANLQAVLQAAGADLDDLVATTTYLVDRADRQIVTQARGAWLTGPAYPTNTLVIVAGLGRPEFRMEISGVAVLPES